MRRSKAADAVRFGLPEAQKMVFNEHRASVAVDIPVQHPPDIFRPFQCGKINMLLFQHVDYIIDHRSRENAIPFINTALLV